MENLSDFKWFAVVEGDELQQGDLLEGCLLYRPKDDPSALLVSESVEFDAHSADVIVLSQSCDLVKGREKVRDVLVGVVYNHSEITDGELSTKKGLENARRGNLPGVHMLNLCDLSGYEREIRIVDFRSLFCLPLAYARVLAARGPRLRLLPPYREHLSQALARFLMRVGLPSDIPPFQ